MAKQKAKKKQTIFKATTKTHHWQIVDGSGPTKDGRVQFSMSILIPPPVSNPLTASGTFNNCCSNPTVQAWLTDAEGDQTQATNITTGGGTPPTSWSATFPTMPTGPYTLTVQTTCGIYVISQSLDISF